MSCTDRYATGYEGTTWTPTRTSVEVVQLKQDVASISNRLLVSEKRLLDTQAQLLKLQHKFYEAMWEDEDV